MAACSGELPYLTARREAGSCETLALFSVDTELSPGAGERTPTFLALSHFRPLLPHPPIQQPGAWVPGADCPGALIWWVKENPPPHLCASSLRL